MTMDYRAIEARADKLLARADRIRSTDAAGAENLELEAAGLNELAASMKAREERELHAIVRNGKPIVGGAGSADVSAFRDYVRTGAEIRNASLSTTDANGGYIVPEPLHAELIEAARKVDPIARLAHTFELSGDTSMVLPYKATHGVVTTATETGARSEQNAPTFEGPSLTCYDYYTDQRATQTSVDAISGFETMLLSWIYGDIWEQAGVDFAIGNGTTKASGLFAGTSVYDVELSGSAGAVANTNFLTLVTKLHPRYQANACWLMTATTLATVSAMSHPAASGYVPLVDWASGEPHILGRPVYIATSAPEIGAANYPIAYGDVGAGYAVGIHRAPSVLRDPYTVTPYIRYYGLARIGGRPFDPEAIILLKSNDT